MVAASGTCTMHCAGGEALLTEATAGLTPFTNMCKNIRKTHHCDCVLVQKIVRQWSNKYVLILCWDSCA